MGVFLSIKKNSWKNQRALGSFDLAKHIPKRIGDFHEINFRDQRILCVDFYFF